MLDFDYACRRRTTSVAAIVNPGGSGTHKAFFGAEEVLIPIYSSLKEAAGENQEADVVVNFASLRSAFQSTMNALECESIRTVAVIAEGIAERHARIMTTEAGKRGKTIIGPATVGGVAAGAFRIGNAGGTLENIVDCKMYRPGSIGLVSKSGGMSNELYHIIAKNTNGLCEGIAVGGDRYPGSTLEYHLMRFQQMPDVKMMVLLGELGGTEEYEVAEAIASGKITKPVVAWVTGTCAVIFPTKVQFGHAGAKAETRHESAEAKNEALKKAGAIVPASYDDFGEKIRVTFEELRTNGAIPELQEVEPQRVPMDYSKAVATGVVRRSASFVSSITDDRGEDVLYAGVPLVEIISQGKGIGEVIGLLWFKKKLPEEASKFIEMALTVTADHGPAVSGAHNAIVAARAGKDLVSCVASGMLTIGPRFGGAIDDAARCFKRAKDAGRSPSEFVSDMKKKNLLISGIGHLLYSVQKPDTRVRLLTKFAHENFRSSEYLDYALEVEKITTKKKSTLILNIDGTIGVLFLDLMKSSGVFTQEEIDEIIELGCLNALFLLGRTIGLIGHALDQKRMKQGLYRQPIDEILYLTE
jgi:succinyl-CoA synthetase alpha subunit